MKNVNIGIDLGTTNSLIAKCENGEVTVFKNPIGFKETLPSVVAYRPDRVLIGDKAREYISKDAINVFSSFKRKMGTDEKYYVVNLDENVTPIELSSLVLGELKNFVQTQEKLDACVITIPASFDTMQSNATLKAGEAGGFAHVYLLQEPIAASLAYVNNKNAPSNLDGYWLVYDFGGGTFDAALVKVAKEEMKIVDNEGNNFLGGVDFDFLIVEKIITPFIESKTGITNFAEQLCEKHGTYEKLYYQLLYLAEEAKKELSNQANTEIEFSTTIDGKLFDFIVPITKQQIDELFLPKVTETIALMKRLLHNNQLQPSDIQQVVLVGGSTYLPIVRQQIVEQLGVSINTSIDPSTAIVVGAAYYASNKYYEPIVTVPHDADAILNSVFSNDDASVADVDVQLTCNSNSRDTEELLMITCIGNIADYKYRITRSDGGFDTGMMPMKNKKSEFLLLNANTNNQFVFSVFNTMQQEVVSLSQTININQGKFSIDGQPLPNDICIEIDDTENRTTKLETVFERNSLLPQKRTMYREISKTIKKGSDDAIIISILEGDKNARPSSNLAIGCIEIKGKDLDFDVVKGSDIEIQLTMTESRILNTEVFLAMTKQEFKNVFSVSEKVVSINRLKEQADILESELRYNLTEFQFREEKVWEIQIEQLLAQVKEAKVELSKLKPKDNSDTKYILAEKLWRISQDADKIGGNDRIAELVERYMEYKEYVGQLIQGVFADKDKIQEKYMRVLNNEATFLHSRNSSVIENGIKQMDDVASYALSNTVPYLIERMIEYNQLADNEFSNANAARNLLAAADRALQNEKYVEFKNNVVGAYQLVIKYRFQSIHSDFKGTGIG
jgi:molecular chaperone DnaK